MLISWRLHVHDRITSQRPHLLLPLHWGLGIQHKNFGGTGILNVDYTFPPVTTPFDSLSSDLPPYASMIHFSGLFWASFLSYLPSCYSTNISGSSAKMSKSDPLTSIYINFCLFVFLRCPLLRPNTHALTILLYSFIHWFAHPIVMESYFVTDNIPSTRDPTVSSSR